MSDRDLDIYISGGVHAGENVPQRIDEIKKHASEIDLLLVEERQGDISAWDTLLNWIASPLLLIGVGLWLNAVLPFLRFVFGGSDQQIIESIEEEYNIERHLVDKPIHRLIREERYLHGSPQYILSLPAVLFLIRFSHPVVQTIAVFSLVCSVAATMLLFLAGTSADREESVPHKASPANSL